MHNEVGTCAEILPKVLSMFDFSIVYMQVYSSIQRYLLDVI